MFGGDGVERWKHCAVDGSGIVKEFADDTWHEEDAVLVERD